MAAGRAARHPRAGEPTSVFKRWQACVAVETWTRAARTTQHFLRPLIDPERVYENNRGVAEGADVASYGEDH